MDIDSVYQGIADAVNNAQLQGNAMQVTATAFEPDTPTVPHFAGGEFTGEYEQSFGDEGSRLAELTMTWRLVLSRALDVAGQQEAQKLAGTGANTIRSAILAARGAPGQKALSGACDDLYVRRVTGPRQFEWGEVAFYGLEFTIFAIG